MAIRSGGQHTAASKHVNTRDGQAKGTDKAKQAGGQIRKQAGRVSRSPQSASKNGNGRGSAPSGAQRKAADEAEAQLEHDLRQVSLKSAAANVAAQVSWLEPSGCQTTYLVLCN